jgi:hypothetical protein
MDLFFRVLASVCLALLMADLLFLGAAFAGNVLPPYIYNYNSVNLRYIRYTI